MPSLRDNPILRKMLDRLFASLVNGPSLNARPHTSRQRIDLVMLERLRDAAPTDVLRDLLGESGRAKIVARVPPPPRPPSDEAPSPQQQAAADAFAAQQAALHKLRAIAEDARSYENDTGVHALHIGYPLLSLPPNAVGRRGFARRVLAPVCFVSLNLTVRAGPGASVLLERREDGADLVVPNIGLLSWLQAQAEQPIGELDEDAEGARPWDEIAQVVLRVARAVAIPEAEIPEPFRAAQRLEEAPPLAPCPRADDLENRPVVLPSAVLGLFPLANQGLIRDTEALLAGEPVDGPILGFVSLGVDPDAAGAAATPADRPREVARARRTFADERLVTLADPCQARAVRLARTARGLVVHGPPGTGKSQTIANVIGDHLARGERVLFVSDKRTALDVVMNRLQALGLGRLCAVVHDPQRDQRDFYRSAREQLEALADTAVDAQAAFELGRVNEELQRVHDALGGYHAALMERPAPDGASFHELMGQWLQCDDGGFGLTDAMLGAEADVAVVERHTQGVREALSRGRACDFPANPWSAAAECDLARFLATPAEQVREGLAEVAARAAAADAAIDATIPPFEPQADVLAAAGARRALAERLRSMPDAPWRELASLSGDALRQTARRWSDLQPQADILAAAPHDAELQAALSDAEVARLNPLIAALEQYLRAMAGFFGFLAFGRKRAAAGALAPFGLPLSRGNAERVRGYLAATKARRLLEDALGRAADASADATLEAYRARRAALDVLAWMEGEAHLAALRPRLAAAEGDGLQAFIAGLERSEARADAIAGVEAAVAATSLFSAAWREDLGRRLRAGEPIGQAIADLECGAGSLEDVLRVQAGLAAMPEALRGAARRLLERGAEPEAGWSALLRVALARAIAARLRATPDLQAADARMLEVAFGRYRELDARRRDLTKAAILSAWTQRQRTRLLSGTGSRLNSAGADLRRRFTLQGRRAMRLRQVIAAGMRRAADASDAALPFQGAAPAPADGDPLFDLRPVWMASPETVAQIFPRQPLFDLIVFDEASQCRLEEALPVLARGRRVFVAGDPKQLPPTRFFESALTTSDEALADDEQRLFEQQQGDIEDLLTAALNIEIEEAYLDVHYRSRNSDLIEFSNIHFYGGRLQPIPGHPSKRSRVAPLTLHRADGVYVDRTNPAEADRVCGIVRDLLNRDAPPSIGIACFNIDQRDLILDRLDELAEEDAAFGRALAEARALRRDGSPEGLFVKNLENVQGDERDHIIISTTYGPDAEGRFYRRFGPLGRAGGGRRLNVLVTRARHEVHLVSSIPASEYRQLPSVPAGQTPSGGYLLFAYLAYAEALAEEYALNDRILASAEATHEPVVHVRPTPHRSAFAETLARRLASSHGTGAGVYWGNDGFCVDLALQHPARPADVSIGVLCDGHRYGRAADPVEWEVFRTGILEWQGWKLHRLWTPQFFRDPSGRIAAILKDAAAASPAP